MDKLLIALVFGAVTSVGNVQSTAPEPPEAAISRDAQCYLATSLAFALLKMATEAGRTSPQDRQTQDAMEAAWMFYSGRISASYPSDEALKAALATAKATLSNDVTSLAGECRSDFSSQLHRTISAMDYAMKSRSARPTGSE